MRLSAPLAVLLLGSVAACNFVEDFDFEIVTDAGVRDAAGGDASPGDAGPSDAGADACSPSATLCDDGCRDLQTDPLACGGCGAVCVGGRCRNGRCVPMIAASGPFACATDRGAFVRCWGQGAYLGDGAFVDRVTPGAVDGSSIMPRLPLRDFTARPASACLLDADGNSSCWTTRESPAPDLDVPPAHEYAFGANYRCVLEDGGRVSCAGMSGRGQLGGAFGVSPTTLDIGAIAIDAGQYTVCALRMPANGVLCWGSNSFGQLGDGSTHEPCMAVPSEDCSPAPVRVTGLNLPTLLAVGTNHACALDADGVKCWGFNGAGQLGDGTAVDSSVPVLVQCPPAAPDCTQDVVQLAANTNISCLAQADGDVWCWGAASALGRVGTAMYPSNSPGPVEFPGASGGVVQLDGYTVIMCAALADSSVWCWGGNNFGQLGDGTTLSSMLPVSVLGFGPPP